MGSMSYGRFAALLGAVTAVIVLMSTLAEGFYDGGIGKLTRDIFASSSAVIESPAPSQPGVPRTVVLSGTYDNVPDGQLIWAVTQDSATKRLYPSDHKCWTDKQEKFDCGEVYVGADDDSSGKTMNLLVVAVTAQAADAFNRYQIDKGGPHGSNQGLDDLPAGAEVLVECTVVRNNK